MALIITEACINCSVCEPECPNHAIYPPSEEWSFADGTQLKGVVTLDNGDSVETTTLRSPISDSTYFIVPWKCTECAGFHEEPQCAAVCPVDCCVEDPEHPESHNDLLSKKEFLH